jgi:hypothetical protein
MKYTTHGYKKGIDDLYILPETDAERDKVTAFLEKECLGYSWQHSDVPGQEWYGKAFIEIPFGEPWLEKIQEVIT